MGWLWRWLSRSSLGAPSGRRDPGFESPAYELAWRVCVGVGRSRFRPVCRCVPSSRETTSVRADPAVRGFCVWHDDYHQIGESTRTRRTSHDERTRARARCPIIIPSSSEAHTRLTTILCDADARGALWATERNRKPGKPRVRVFFALTHWIVPLHHHGQPGAAAAAYIRLDGSEPL